METLLREEITERVRRGDPLDDIDAELIGSRPWLDEDERSALWLYAWVGTEHRERFALRGEGGAGESFD